MEIKIVKIDREFVIVELKNCEQKVCPLEIFPLDVEVGDTICLFIKN